MVLHPLEFSECHLDPPWFRENIQQYEEELEKTSTQIKHLIKDGKSMLNACRIQGKMMNQFNDRLQSFYLDFGANLTDDEKRIAGSLKEFGLMLEEVAGEWFRTIERSELQLLKPLDVFRKEHIHSYRESKKTFEKASERYYKQLEQTLGLSHKKKLQQLEESDNELAISKKTFHREALRYVYKLQEVQERKKFEFVEHLLMFMQVYFNYFHQTHETASDCKDYMKDLQMRLVTTREQYDGTRDKTETLMKRMADQPNSEENNPLLHSERWSRAGYLFLMEKHPLTARLSSKWSKYFCMYTKENKLFQMASPYHASSNAGSVGAKVNLIANSAGVEFLDPMIITSCTRRSTDSIDKRFCFDLDLEDTSGKQFTFTFQALSDVDRKKWMSVMDGKEPAYVQAKDFRTKENVFALNEAGFECVKKIIAEIERRGVHHEGIYRLVGVVSKVDMLLRQSLNPSTVASVNYSDEDEWEINTLTSALKSYFRNLPEPIMTFEFHQDFINAAKCDLHDDRVKKISTLVNKLPEDNRKILSLLVDHLEKVQDHHEENKMTVQNLGVCFGPTLMRHRQETVQAIMEIKFSNIIVEILVEERHIIFGDGESMLNQQKRDLPARPASPKLASKALSHRARLPSQRLRLKSRESAYEIASMPNLLEENHNTTDGNTASMRFARPKTLHEYQPLPRVQESKGEKRASQLSTSSEEGEPYRLSSHDLVDSDQTKPSSVTGVSTSPSGGQVRPVSKEQWSFNGAMKPSKEKFKPLVPPKKPGLVRSRSSGSKGSGDAFVSSNKDLKQSPPVPQPKKRIQSMLHSKPISLSAFEGPIQIDQGKNKNNNNAKNFHIPLLSKPARPKTLAQPLPTKDDMPPTNEFVETRKKNANLNITPGSSPEKKSLFHTNKRPKSEFIPAVFLTTEINNRNGANKGSSEKSSSFRQKSLKNEFKKIIPRSSALVSVRSPEREKQPGSSESSDESDIERTSTRARALYDCKAEQVNELSFEQGQVFCHVEKSNEPGWLLVELNGKPGLVPRNYVEFI